MVKKLLKISNHFQSLDGFLFSISFVRIVLNARFSVASMVLVTKTVHDILGHTHSWVRPNSFREAPHFRVLVFLSVFPRDPHIDRQESPIASNLLSSMSMEELRSFCQVLDGICLELSDGSARSIVEQVDNVVYITKEQFATGLLFLVSSLVKQFLHVTRAPPALVHPNVFQILMGCNVLNFLYQLDMLLAEICFIYTLKLGTGGRLSMSAHSPGYNL